MGAKKAERDRAGRLIAVQYGRCRECDKQIRRQKQLNATTEAGAEQELVAWEPDFIHDRCWAINRAFAQIMAEDIIAGRPGPWFTPATHPAAVTDPA
jgi:hypothetical protein